MPGMIAAWHHAFDNTPGADQTWKQTVFERDGQQSMNACIRKQQRQRNPSSAYQLDLWWAETWRCMADRAISVMTCARAVES